MLNYVCVSEMWNLVVKILYTVDTSPEYILDVSPIMMTNIAGVPRSLPLHEHQTRRGLSLIVVQCKQIVHMPTINDFHIFSQAKCRLTQ